MDLLKNRFPRSFPLRPFRLRPRIMLRVIEEHHDTGFLVDHGCRRARSRLFLPSTTMEENH